MDKYYIPKCLFEDDTNFINFDDKISIKFITDIIISNRYEKLIIFISEIVKDVICPYKLETDASRCIFQKEFTGPPYCNKDNILKTVYILQDGIILIIPNFHYKIRISSYNDLEYDIILMDLNDKFVDIFGYCPKKIKYTLLKEEILFLLNTFILY